MLLRYVMWCWCYKNVIYCYRMLNYVEVMFYNVKFGYEMVCCICDRG